MLDGAGGLKPCLSAWKSAKADSISRESWLAEQLHKNKGFPFVTIVSFVFK